MLVNLRAGLQPVVMAALATLIADSQNTRARDASAVAVADAIKRIETTLPTLCDEVAGMARNQLLLSIALFRQVDAKPAMALLNRRFCSSRP